MSDRQTAAQGSVALLASFAVIAVLNYVFAVALSWLLPIEAFGVVGVVQALLLLGATVIGAGFPSALAREIARDADETRRAARFRQALAGNMALGLALGGAVALGGALRLVEPAEAYAGPMVAAGLTIMVLALSAVLVAALQGLVRLREVAVVRAAEVILKAGSGLALVALGMGATGAIVGFLMGAAVATILAAIPLRRVRGFGVNVPARPQERPALSGVLPFLVGVSGLALLSQADILALKVFAPGGQSEFLAGQYQVAAILARLPYFAAVALFAAVFPFVARHAGDALAGAYARLALKYTLIALVPATVVLGVVPDDVIRIFFSQKYDQSADALRVAALATVLLTIAYAFAVLLQAHGRAALAAGAVVVGVVVHFAIASVIVPAAGLVGGAASLAIASAVVGAILLPATHRAYGLEVRIRHAAGWSISLAVLVAVLVVLPTAGRLEAIVAIALAALAYLVALAVTGLVTRSDVLLVGGALGHGAEPLTRRAGSLVETLRVIR